MFLRLDISEGVKSLVPLGRDRSFPSMLTDRKWVRQPGYLYLKGRLIRDLCFSPIRSFIRPAFPAPAGVGKYYIWAVGYTQLRSMSFGHLADRYVCGNVHPVRWNSRGKETDRGYTPMRSMNLDHT